MQHLPEYDLVDGICQGNVHEGCTPSTHKLSTVEVSEGVLPEQLPRFVGHPDPLCLSVSCLPHLHWVHDLQKNDDAE